jgi:uncharacterized membrane protein YedE/YeeE
MVGTQPGQLTWGLMINGGIILGAMVSAMLSGEFRFRRIKHNKQYLQILLGGILMGYGAGLASGCTIGGFFSAVPSLGLNGFVFGGAIAIGAYIGVKLVSKIG